MREGRRRVAGPVRVCFLIDRLSRAGTESQLLALINSLDRSRALPSLVLLDGTDDASRSLEPTNCPILRLGLRSLLGSATPTALNHLRRFWRRQRIDIVQTYFLDSTYCGVPFARLCGIKKVIRVRNNQGYWLTNTHKFLGRWMGRLAHVTLTNSEGGKQALLDTERLPAEKVAVLENGVDLERFPDPQLPEMGEIIRVGLVANLRPVKGIDSLVRVAAQLCSAHPGLRFEVAGDGEQRHSLEQMITAHGLRDRFELLGAVAGIPSFLARQDIAILCSHSEGMSNSLLEYMASGRAIVATDVGANGRLIANGSHGLIVPPQDDAALAAAISWLIGNPGAARDFAAAARRRVENEYARAVMVKRFEDFYHQLLH